MKSIAVVLIIFTWSLTAFGQDSLRVTSNIRLYDSLMQLSQKQFLRDSIISISWRDSLRSKVHVAFNKDSIRFKNQIDSLHQRGLPTLPQSALLDSAIQLKDARLTEIEQRQEELVSGTKARMDEWRAKIKEKLGVQSLPGVTQTAFPVSPDMTTQFPQAGALKIEASTLPEMPALGSDDFRSVGLSPELGQLNETLPSGNIDGLKGIQDKVPDTFNSINDLSSNSQNIDKLAESGISGLKETEALKEIGEGLPSDEFTGTADLLKDPQALKEELKEQAIEKAVNHFEGKEEVLQQAMDKISGYKQKYESVNSLSEIKKRPPNPMKGKPFIERLVPGVAFQLQQRNDLMLDVNPYAGYRITGRLTTGAGWNQRVGYDLDEYHFTSLAVVYGPRLFGEFKFWRGFTARVETEWMNTHVPSKLGLPFHDAGRREWVNSVFAGVKKDYRFMKSVKGTAFIMFNLFNPDHKSPYGDVVNTRFGFEFPIRKVRR